eukprot:gene7316-9880_t
MIVIGGLGSVHGAFLGAIFLISMPQLISLSKDWLPATIGQAPGLQAVVYGAVLIAFVLFEPMGLYGRWLKVRTWFQLFPLYRMGILIGSNEQRLIAFGPEPQRALWRRPGGAMLPLTDQPPHKVAGLGIARTFQNIELFEHASVLHNLLIGRHTRQHSSLWTEMFFTRKVREGEILAREKAEQVIDFLDLQHYRDTMVAGLPYGVRKETDDMAFWIQDIQHELGIT